jgi:3-hydroxyisobutyrate dehydrogenase-like beta-hydroxyacid dehydrogenase
MASNVLKSGFPVTVFDKNPRTMENLIRAGAKAATSAKQVV